jgi:hypothetical protein
MPFLIWEAKGQEHEVGGIVRSLRQITRMRYRLEGGLKAYGQYSKFRV